MTALTISLEEIPTIVAKYVDSLAKLKSAGATVITLSGDLGAGKTTFVQAIANHLGVAESVQSPTFVLMKTYSTTSEIFPQLVHIDAYRITDESELAVIHLDEILSQPNTLVCIEWPEHIASVIPDYTHSLSFAVADTTTRYVTGLPSTMNQ